MQSPFCYQVRLLGGLSIALVEGTQRIPLSVPGGNAQTLLAYLLLHPQMRHPRERLGEIFWPQASPDRLRRNLSDLLYRLRQALNAEWFTTNAETVMLRTDLDLTVDVWTFETEIKQGSIAALERAVGCYSGELLPELYEDWVLVPRVALQESYLNALSHLATDAEKRQALGRALVYYRQLSQADPLREEGHRGLMRVLAHQGRLDEALTIYDDLVVQLRRQLDAPPSAATQRLARQLQSERDARKADVVPKEPLFVGRRPERAALLRAVEAVGAGRGGVIAIEGEAGMGKTRLVQVVAESARWRAISVATGQAPDLPADSPLAPLRQIVTEALAPPRAAQVSNLLDEAELAALAPLYPSWAEHQESLLDLPAERARERFYTAARQLVAALGAIGPHLLILDDAHWTEPALWDLLDALVPVLAQNRLLLLITYRRDPLQRGPGWERLSQWEAEGALQIVTLAPLSTAEIAQMTPPHLQEQADRIRAATGGVPFYVHEFLLNAADEVIAPQQAVAQRARRLAPNAWTALEAAAVIGEQIPYRLWKTITDRSDDELSAIGQQLVQRVLLRPAPEGYVFVHALIQESVYREIPPDRQRQLHRQIADHLAADPASLRLRALHLDRAGAGVEAAALYRQVGKQAVDQFAYTEAQTALVRALALAPEDASADRVETLLDLARVCEITGDRTQQKRALDEALALADQLGDETLVTQTLVELGNWAARTGAHDAARAHLDRALALAQQHDDAKQELAIELILGDLLWRSGDPRTASAHFETALALAQRLDDSVAEGRALEGMAWTISQSEGDSEKAFALYEQALSVQRSIGDQLGEARTLLNILSSYQNIGAWDQLYFLADQVVAAQQRVHYRLGEAVTHQALGLAAYALGDYDQAKAEVSAARAGFDKVGERLGVVITTDTLGLIAQRRGDMARAEELFAEALALASLLDANIFTAFVQQDYGIFLIEQKQYAQGADLLRRAIQNWHSSGEQLNPLKCKAALGLALRAQGRREEAADLAAQGWQAFQDEEIGGEEIQSWYWMLARLHRALDENAQADALIDAAYAELLRQAGVLSDPTMRRRFFADVPLNAAIVAARDERTGIVRQQTVTLARSDAPLGKPLSPEETVTLTWTIHAPEDDLLQDKTERRRAVLVRLVREAAARGAAPTDQDLADALDVSRRTILRDSKALADQGVDLLTRARR